MPLASTLEKDKRVFQPKLLREAREKHGLSQQELAQQVGITQGHLSEIERGEAEPRSNLVAAFCQTLGLSADDLLGTRPNPKTTDNPFEYLGFTRHAYEAASVVNQLTPADQEVAIRLIESLGREIAMLRAAPPDERE